MTHRKIWLFAVFTFLSLGVLGQMGVAYDLKKPAKFENRILASEKSNTGKKIKKARRFVQNTITHYNFYFNANEKINMIIARAKAQNRDDYTRLLPFYNYSLDVTASQKKELDSVIYKCTMGILIHDTRNDWIDNLYMLIGKTYYFKKDFDSAYITFQFINYAFAPKEEDGYDKPIGSNYNEEEGGNANIVATKEKRDLLHKAFATAPSRNESLIWKVRTYIAKEQFAEAAGLIEVLRRDPLFPARLEPSLQEVRALWFYKQNNYDSAAWHLEKALPAAENMEEQARWEYLIAQLYERADNSFEARTFYERTVRHTYNPVLEVYARLNSIRQNKEGGEDFIQKNIAALASMARKDRYEPYRDIIYYTAAQMELERNNKPGAEAFLLLCIKSSSLGGFDSQRNKAFLQLANLCFEEKKYKAAKNYYDSLVTMQLGPNIDISWLPDRKAALSVIVAQLQILERQDSLQRIAALPPDQRNAYIKKLVKTLRRLQGLREDDQSDSSSSFNSSGFNNQNKQAPDLFSAGAGNADWYFNNSSLKAKGYSDFKTKWGNRPNVDNWQLASLVKNQQAVRTGEKPPTGPPDVNGKNALAAPAKIDFKSLMDNLPLTPEKMKKLTDSVDNALFTLGKAYQEGIADYQSAINTYESLLEKTEDFKREETLFNLYYCYKKIGDEVNAQRILLLMKQKYPQGKQTAKAVNPDSTAEAGNSLKINATHQYEKIYTSFIEGRFEEALAQKKMADSLYGDKYWTPQLLYIESVYFIRNRQDQQAISTLATIPLKYPKTPMAAKATALIDVLKRRKQIEEYLTNLQVTRVPDDSVVMDTTSTAKTAVEHGTRLIRNDSNMLVKEDTSQLAKAKIHLPTAPGIQGQKPSPALSGADKMKVDMASMNKISMDAGQLAQLRRTVDSLQAAMQKAMADSLQLAKLQRQSDSAKAAMKKLQADTAQLAARIRTSNSPFAYTPDKPHSVMIVMDKVDPVYVTEARNAFNRYNQENFYGQSLTIDNSSVSDSLKLVVIGSFENAGAALDYMHKAQASAAREIVPWLPVNKYSFMIISGTNLDLLLNNKDMPAYKRFDALTNPNEKH